MSPWLNKTHSAWLLSQTWSWLYLTVWPEYVLTTVDDCQIFKGARKYAMKYHTFRTRYVQVTYALMGCKNNNECVNVSLEKPFQVRSQIHSSSLSVNNKIKHRVSSALLLSTQPIKNLLGRVQEPPDPITRGQVGLGVEGHVPSAAPQFLLTRYFQLFPSWVNCSDLVIQWN